MALTVNPINRLTGFSATEALKPSPRPKGNEKA